jgi:hypothetical protein
VSRLIQLHSITGSLKLKVQRSLGRYTLEPIVMGRTEWVSVLKLSTLWRFGELREEALDELAQMEIDPIDKVILARDYRVEKWLVEGYTELVKRDAGLSAEERKRLGYETAFQLYERREESFRRGLSYGTVPRACSTLWMRVFVMHSD